MVFGIVNDLIVLLDPYLVPKAVLPLQIFVDLGVMAMKEYSSFPKVTGLEPLHQMA